MTHYDFKALELYNQISVLEQNNHNGRYNKRIQELKKELETVLAKTKKG